MTSERAEPEALRERLTELAEIGGQVLACAMYGLWDECDWQRFETALRRAKYVLSGDPGWIETNPVGPEST